jgi:rhodanese-related sulfurtransferase
MVSMRAALALLSLAPGLAAAQHAVVTADEVLALTARKERRAVVVDARSPQEFRAVRIRGAINLPPERVEAEAGRLPRDKGTPLVFYCRGPG